MDLTYYEIAAAVGATNDWRTVADFPVTGIEFDTRNITEGALFVPLSGTRDGHEFIDAAVENGAATAFWAHDSQLAPKDLPILQVVDTLAALQNLAKYYLKKNAPTVIGITGSNGKTTTKDMTAAVLSQKFATYKTQGNFNNQIGLPYTILHMPAATEVLVLEMGMDHEGEIDFLTRLAEPDIAAITLIGESHLEYFGTRDGIAKAKMEIVAGLKPTGMLIVPGDEPLLEPLLPAVTQAVITFGLDDSEELYATILESGKESVRFTINRFPNEEFTIPVPGAYNVRNAIVAAMIGSLLEVPVANIKTALATVELTRNRTEWLKRSDGLEVLSDVYNANPTAMRLVLENFAQMPTTGRRIAVIGDMLELGEQSQQLHAQMSTNLDPEMIQEVFLYGTEMQALFDVLATVYPAELLHYYPKAEKAALITDLANTVTANDMLVLKASNGMGLNEVVTAILSGK